jgi:hypothetical protein
MVEGCRTKALASTDHRRASCQQVPEADAPFPGSVDAEIPEVAKEN